MVDSSEIRKVRLLGVKCGNNFSVGGKNNGRKEKEEEEKREKRGKKDRVGNRGLREEGRALVTHCSGNSSDQGVVGYMRQTPHQHPSPLFPPRRTGGGPQQGS